MVFRLSDWLLGTSYITIVIGIFKKPFFHSFLHKLGYLLCWRSYNTGVPAVAGFSAFDYVLAVVGVLLLQVSLTRLASLLLVSFLLLQGIPTVVGFSAVVGIPAVVSIADVIGSLLLLIFLLLVVSLLSVCRACKYTYEYSSSQNESVFGLLQLQY
jgi:hypothetical protein